MIQCLESNPKQDIILLLEKNQKMVFSDIAKNMPDQESYNYIYPDINQHLTRMVQTGLLSKEKVGKNAYYQLSKNYFKIKNLIEQWGL